MSPTNRNYVLDDTCHDINNSTDLIANHCRVFFIRLQPVCKLGSEYSCYLVYMNAFDYSSSRSWRLNNHFELLRHTSIPSILFIGTSIRRGYESNSYFIDYPVLFLVMVYSRPYNLIIGWFNQVLYSSDEKKWHHKKRHYNDDAQNLLVREEWPATCNIIRCQ